MQYPFRLHVCFRHMQYVFHSSCSLGCIVLCICRPVLCVTLCFMYHFENEGSNYDTLLLYNDNMNRSKKSHTCWWTTAAKYEQSDLAFKRKADYFSYKHIISLVEHILINLSVLIKRFIAIRNKYPFTAFNFIWRLSFDISKQRITS